MYNKDRFHADANGCSRGYVNKASCSEESSCCIGGVDLITLVCDLLWPNKSPWVYFYVVLFFILQIFTLSALPIERMPLAIQECFSVLKPGGMLLFRDYGNSSTCWARICSVRYFFMDIFNFCIVIKPGLYDMTMLRFAPEQRIGYREYMRSDGTRSYFFSLESLRDLFSNAGFIVVHIYLSFSKACHFHGCGMLQKTLT